LPVEFAERKGPRRRASTAGVQATAWGNLEFSVATTPATARHRQLALAVVIAASIAYLAIIPYAHIRLPRIDSFVPTIFAISIVGDLITAVLLFGQYTATRSRPLLVLAGGYLFASIVRAGFVLTFPGAFTPDGLFGAGPQSAAWLGVLSRSGLSIAVAIYAVMTLRARKGLFEEAPASSAVLGSVAIVVIAAFALIYAATAGHDLWPPLLSNDTVLPIGSIVNAAFSITNVVALVLLASTRGKSILDLWLIVAVLATLIESVMIVLFFHELFSLAFYAIRLISLPVTKVVLIVLLWETMRLYTNLAIANRELQRERANRLTNAAVGLAAIAHEIRQPLAGINMTASAGQKILKRSPPDVAGAEEHFRQITHASQRAGEVFTSILGLFRQSDQGRLQALDANEAIVEAAGLMRQQLDEHNIALRTELAPDLPLVRANAGQLRTVILNVMQNSIEAMAPTTGEPRTIRIATSLLGSGAVCISFEDTGPGIVADDLATIFDPFVTTKAQGTGLGLAICKMVIEQHGGALSAGAGGDGGARFEITLPPA
jgi:signal transduction histidine kinase